MSVAMKELLLRGDFIYCTTVSREIQVFNSRILFAMRAGRNFFRQVFKAKEFD